MARPPPFSVVYRVIEGREIDVDIYLPESSKADENVKHPVIIDIHGGAFMLGSSQMVNRDQIEDCLSRGWIVLAPNHRLCPQVSLLNGPIQDCRALLAWVHDGGLQAATVDHGASYLVDLDHVFAFGTSSGGTLALCLGFGVPRPVAGIFDMYGPCNFSHPSWTTPLPQVAALIPPELTKDFMMQIFDEDPVPVVGGVSLEGQQVGAPDFQDPRQAYAFTQIANGTVVQAICPSVDLDLVDPIANITPSFPPTFIVHGEEDKSVPLELSRNLYAALVRCGVECVLRVIPEEGHTFAARMKPGSRTWNLHREGFDFLASLTK